MLSRSPALTARVALLHPDPTLRPVAVWLVIVAILVFVMVVIGGITRLTESGLSIVTWAPFTGVIPPLSDADWRELFTAYQATPEFIVVNRHMDLDDFKTIFWWEYVHRLWGRLIGAAFLVPFLWFVGTGRLKGALAVRVGAVFLLGALQGGLGWYMVQSGLVDDPRVSPYRLAAHLALAVTIYGYLLWLALDLVSARGAEPAPKPLRRRLACLWALIALTMLSGAFVAGLDAGLAYNTFPLMDERLVPRGLLRLEPLWRNVFENLVMVQFNHRLLAYVTLGVAAATVIAAMRHRGPFQPWRHGVYVLGALVLLQVGLGVATLLAYVPVALGVAHQANALLAFTVALWTAHRMSGSHSVQPERDARPAEAL
jgi:cytochrome c oxidase assembly protein subunit 15